MSKVALIGSCQLCRCETVGETDVCNARVVSGWDGGAAVTDGRWGRDRHVRECERITQRPDPVPRCSPFCPPAGKRARRKLGGDKISKRKQK